MYNIMNNSADYQTDLASYNNEIASEFAKRDERTAAMRGQLERQKDERIANLTDKGKDFESAAREWLEAGLGGGAAAKEILSGGKNVRKLGRGIAKLGQKGYKAVQQFRQNQPFQEGEEEPGIELPGGEPEGDLGGESMNEPVTETGEQETNLFGKTNDPRYNQRAQEGNNGTQEEEKTSNDTEELKEDTEETKEDTPDNNENNSSNAADDATEDATQDVEKSVTQGVEDEGADLGGELASDSLLDFLGPIGWAVGGGLAIAGVVEEVVNANKSHNASEQAEKLRNQAVNVRPQPVNISGSYVAPSKSAIY